MIGPVRGGRNPTAYQRGRPQRYAGYARTGGFYGRYGMTARRLGNIPEKKFFDTPMTLLIDSTAEVSTSGLTGGINLIPQGDTESTRDGRQCTIVSIQVRGVVTYVPAAAATASGATYIYLLQDMQANGAYPAQADVFDSAEQGRAFMNMANSKRFKIIKKWKHTWNPPAGVSGAYNSVTKIIEWYKTCNISLEFSSTTGAISEIKSNNLFFAFGATGTSIDDLVTASLRSRLRFRG